MEASDMNSFNDAKFTFEDFSGDDFNVLGGPWQNAVYHIKLNSHRVGRKLKGHHKKHHNSPHKPNYQKLGDGWCLSSQDKNQLPALWKNIAHFKGDPKTELQKLCDSISTCNAIDLGNNMNGHLRFASAADLHEAPTPDGF